MKNNHTTKILPNTRATAAVHLMLFNEKNRLLMLRRKNTGYQDGMWQIPAGHVLEGDTFTTAMVRKAYDEIGIILDPTELRFVHISCRAKHDDTGTRVDIFFRADLNWRPVAIKCLRYCDKIKWVMPGELPELTTPHIADGIKDSFSAKMLTEHPLAYVMENPLYMDLAAK